MHPKIKWELRTDGRTVIDDLNDLRNDPERLQKICDQVVSEMLAIAIHGAIAQLGERILGRDEVGGSIPPSSTKI